ncbi:hypothetical protein [Burkholderia sp. S-53]|uniref:hypothetical protein n=1 Tax=Burkholderia sp. S-53 TaxID=2906514 RepID=UPI0021CF5800|nr:hypothetical protein [Burkholderia sp. S-53]UXU89085.1 hypothetical protein LXM88_11675 [Burkholderia sp. S-53]
MSTDSDFHSNWSRTSEYLREARAHRSESAEGVCADEIVEFDKFLILARKPLRRYGPIRISVDQNHLHGPCTKI